MGPEVLEASVQANLFVSYTLLGHKFSFAKKLLKIRAFDTDFGNRKHVCIQEKERKACDQFYKTYPCPFVCLSRYARRRRVSLPSYLPVFLKCSFALSLPLRRTSGTLRNMIIDKKGKKSCSTFRQ